MLFEDEDSYENEEWRGEGFRFFNVDGEPISQSDWECLYNFGPYRSVGFMTWRHFGSLITRWVGYHCDYYEEKNYVPPMIFETLIDIYADNLPVYFFHATLDEARAFFEFKMKELGARATLERKV